MPALLVFGFVKIFKKQLADNPTKNQVLKYAALYFFVIAAIAALLILLFHYI
jgi:hypothetical protein